MKFQDVARFEFRQFGADLTPAKEVFAALGAGHVQPPSRETYMATRLTIEGNVKIRQHRLEVKRLQGRWQMLEQWQPVLKAAFPVPAGDIEDVVAPALGIDVDLGAVPPLSAHALLALVAEQPALAVVVLDKHRTLFDLGDCEAEFCELQIGEERLHTIAIEAPKAEAAQAVMQHAGLEGMQNESYPLFLQEREFASAR